MFKNASWKCSMQPIASHHPAQDLYIRDVGVAGSKPVTPTRILEDPGQLALDAMNADRHNQSKLRE